MSSSIAVIELLVQYVSVTNSYPMDSFPLFDIITTSNTGSDVTLIRVGSTIICLTTNIHLKLSRAFMRQVLGDLTIVLKSTRILYSHPRKPLLSVQDCSSPSQKSLCRGGLQQTPGRIRRVLVKRILTQIVSKPSLDRSGRSVDKKSDRA